MTGARGWQAGGGRSHGKRLRTWAGGVGFGVLAGLFIGAAQIVDPTWAWILRAAATGAFVIALVQGTLSYMRRIDEHERHANLRAAYSGLAVYLGLYVAQTLADIAGYTVAWGQHAIFAIVCLVTITVYLWDRYR